MSMRLLIKQVLLLSLPFIQIKRNKYIAHSLVELNGRSLILYSHVLVSGPYKTTSANFAVRNRLRIS